MKYFKLFEQYNLNAAFWKWFGASKAVDAQGNPLVVYHGTAESFITFDKSKIGANYRDSERSGFFFIQKEQSAKNYAKLHSAAKINSTIHAEDVPSGYVMKVYLSFQNPLVREVNSDYRSPADYFDVNSINLMQDVEQGGYDGIIIKGTHKDTLCVALNANQIKAVDNDGTWDIKDNDIYS